MKSARLLLLLAQIVCGLLLACGATWAFWFVVAAPLIAAVMP